MKNKKKFTYIGLLANPLLSKARFKGIGTIMRRRKISFEKAMRIQAKAIIREQNDKKSEELQT